MGSKLKKYRILTLTQTAAGFSLLELLFVVAILATIATFGLSIYRQRTVNVKVTRAAAEIQQILQAGSAFYADKGQWPVGQSQTGEEFEKNYLPFGKVRKSPWGEEYAYQPFADTVSDVKKARLFQVETWVPTETAASQMAAQLPNSEVEVVGRAYKVKSQVAVPGQDKAVGNSYLIVEIGEIGNGKPGTDERSRYLNARLDKNNNVRRVNFDCPVGMGKGMFFIVDTVNSGKGPAEDNRKPYLLALATFEVLLEEKECDKAGCEIKLNMRYWGNCGDSPCWFPDAYVKVQYIAYCQWK